MSRKTQKLTFKQSLRLAVGLLVVCGVMAAISSLQSKPATSQAAPVQVQNPVTTPESAAAKANEFERSAKQEQFCHQANIALPEPQLTQAIAKCITMTEDATLEDLNTAFEIASSN